MPVESEFKTNSLTGKPYWRAFVQSLGGHFDVMADPELVAIPLVSGEILQGGFWLSGRILTAPPHVPAAPRFFSKLFGKKQ
jgi:hypothetical protein